MDSDSDQTKRLLCEFGYSYELEVYPDPGMSLQGNSVELKNFVRNCYLCSSIPSFLKLLGRDPDPAQCMIGIRIQIPLENLAMKWILILMPENWNLNP